MSNVIRIKRRASGAAGAPASLENAEQAFNEVDSILYYGKGTGGVGGSATTIIAIGGDGAFMALTGNQTVAGTKTFSSTITGAISGNAGTATALATSRTISVSGDISGSASFDGTANAAITATLPTVNSNVGTYTKITINAKGLATAGVQASLTDLSSPSADFSFNSHKLTNLTDPTAAQDAATKAYVDAVAQGLKVKDAARCATTANITLSGAQTIDGVSAIAGDRVLVKNQSTASQNGIYVVAAGAWSRATDADIYTELVSAFCFVSEGSTLADTGWVCTANLGGTLGTTSLPFAQFSGAGSYLAGNGLGLSGSTFSVTANGATLDVSASGVKISDTYAGQSSITTVGTIATGVWSGTAVVVAKGGTGATTLTGVLKGNGTSAFTAAVDGTDYLSPSATIDCGTF